MSALHTLLGPLASAATWKRTAHLLLDLPFAIAWFTVVVTGVSLGVGTLVLVFGLPVLVVTLLFGRVISSVERWRCRVFLDEDIAPAFDPLPREGGLWQQAWAVLKDPAGWRALVYGFSVLVSGVITFTITVVVWAVGLGSVAFPTFAWALPPEDVYGGFLRDEPGLRGLLFAATGVVGLLVLLAAPWVVAGLAAFDRAFVRAFLGRDQDAALQARLVRLERSRSASVDAAEAERRRIERDLHDGVQQHLVALAMDLGLARSRLERDGDPGSAELVGRAHDEAKRAIAELRELVRGIHPAVLTDRGLDAALSALAARCPVPVELLVDLPSRPAPPLETAAYYVVGEALTNVAKHAGATRTRVVVARRGGVLAVEVTDDGAGGAAARAGGGLSGLEDRVVAVQGRLEVHSPPGGPTTVRAELPWADPLPAPTGPPVA